MRIKDLTLRDWGIRLLTAIECNHVADRLENLAYSMLIGVQSLDQLPDEVRYLLWNDVAGGYHSRLVSV